jgi:hypothetical protein
VREIGHERVFPVPNPDRRLASPVNAVLAAQISDDAKRAILRDARSESWAFRPAPPFRPPTPRRPPRFDVHALQPTMARAPDRRRGDRARARSTRHHGQRRLAGRHPSDVVAGNAQGRASANPRTGQLPCRRRPGTSTRPAPPPPRRRWRRRRQGPRRVRRHAHGGPATADLFAARTSTVRSTTRAPTGHSARGDCAPPSAPADHRGPRGSRREPRGRVPGVSTDNVYLEMGSSYAQLDRARDRPNRALSQAALRQDHRCSTAFVLGTASHRPTDDGRDGRKRAALLAPDGRRQQACCARPTGCGWSAGIGRLRAQGRRSVAAPPSLPRRRIA